MDVERECSKCGVTKPLDRFSKHKACRDGYQRICKDCKNAYLREYMAASEEQRRRRAVRKWEWRQDPENRAYENAKQYASNGRSPERQAHAARKHLYKKQYGLTLEGYDRMLKKQGGGCAICGGQPTGKHKYFHIDHDHGCCPLPEGRRQTITCGKCIRGLLCSSCNTGLGLFRDDRQLLKRAVAYLQRTNRKDI